MTLTGTEGQSLRSKVTKMNTRSYLKNYFIHRHHTRYYGTIQLVTSNKINFLDLDVRSKVTDVEVSAFSECFLLNAIPID